jgi:hypothetical protein
LSIPVLSQFIALFGEASNDLDADYQSGRTDASTWIPT